MGWPMEETQKEADDIQEGWKWLEVCVVHVPWVETIWTFTLQHFKEPNLTGVNLHSAGHPLRRFEHNNQQSESIKLRLLI